VNKRTKYLTANAAIFSNPGDRAGQRLEKTKATQE
jgi:hypothetical protein